jgi:CubicO group peptidase (beta-lactamase class C family)
VGKRLGHIVGEVVRRITGTSIGRFFAHEIAGPLGADFHIGLPKGISPGSPTSSFRAIRSPTTCSRSRWIPTACRPRLTAHRSTRWRRRRPVLGVARRSLPVTGTATHGPLPGSADRLQRRRGRRCQVVVTEDDRADLRSAVRRRRPRAWAAGEVRGRLWPATPRPGPVSTRWSVLFWFGWGGVIVVNDLDRQMTYADVMNKMASML